MGAIIAVINKKGESAADTAVAMLKALKQKSAETYGIASPTTIKTEKSAEALKNNDLNSPIIIGHAFSRIFPTDKPQPTKLDDATLVFEGRIYPTTTKISGVEAVTKKLRQNREEATKTLIKKSEDGFALAIAESERLIVGRDAMGIRPLHYGENTDLVALASERKALWRVGIETVASFPPGHIALVNKNGFKFKPAKTLVYAAKKQITLQAAVEKLQELLEQSIKERVSGLKEVAVAFSGGLDSSIIALLIRNLGVNAHLIHVSLENQPEIEHAKKAAEELKLPIHIYLYNEGDVKEVLPDVLWLTEEPNPVKTSIGIPVYWAAEKAAEMKIKVMLSGQGADELFGGYKRYLNDYLQYGSEKVQETILNDIVSMHETNFERDFKICNFHNVELRLPFATYQMAKFAIDLPLELKIESPTNSLRKLVLRRVAENLGLPQLIVKKPKRAIQYTTGINKTIKKLAKRKGLPIKEYLQNTFQTLLHRTAQNE